MEISRRETFEEVLLNEMMLEVLDNTRTHPSVTDLIYCLTKNWLNAKRTKPQQLSRQTKLFFAIGLGMEDNMLKQRKNVLASGVYNGVSYHADSIDDELVEFKTTRTNPAKYPEGIPLHHLRQMMTYLKAVGKTRVMYSVLFLIQADLHVYELTFTQEEIDKNWEWIELRKQVWEEADRTLQAPESFKHNESWECLRCDFKTLCTARTEGVIRL